jgi:hypothetical protein
MFFTAYYVTIRGRIIHKTLQMIGISGNNCLMEGTSPSDSDTGRYLNMRELFHSAQNKNFLLDL